MHAIFPQFFLFDLNRGIIIENDLKILPRYLTFAAEQFHRR